VESLSNWAGDTIQIRFSAKRDVGFSWWTNSRVCIDDILVEETPSCDLPFSMTSSNMYWRRQHKSIGPRSIPHRWPIKCNTNKEILYRQGEQSLPLPQTNDGFRG
jgi:hypothetical protein